MDSSTTANSPSSLNSPSRPSRPSTKKPRHRKQAEDPKTAPPAGEYPRLPLAVPLSPPTLYLLVTSCLIFSRQLQPRPPPTPATTAIHQTTRPAPIATLSWPSFLPHHEPRLPHELPPAPLPPAAPAGLPSPPAQWRERPRHARPSPTILSHAPESIPTPAHIPLPALPANAHVRRATCHRRDARLSPTATRASSTRSRRPGFGCRHQCQAQTEGGRVPGRCY